MAAQQDYNFPEHDSEAVYRRFSPRRKKLLVAICSFCGLLPFFVSGTFVPSIPQIAKELNSTGPVISLAVSLSIFSNSLGALSGATYSTYYGRRAAYLLSLPLLFIGSIGVAHSNTVTQLMVWRFIQSVGSSPGSAVGAGVIGDIFKLEERGGGMGVFLSVSMVGCALAPLLGGLAAQYSSWRFAQLALGMAGLFAFLFIYIFLPETCHPGTRGCEQAVEEGRIKTSWRPVFINPFKPLWLLRSPNLLVVTFAGAAALMTDYVLLVPLAYTIGARYNITNDALIGACFAPSGLGNMGIDESLFYYLHDTNTNTPAVGSPIAGYLSDKFIVQWRAKRGGKWYPEDRLRATLPGALLLVPLSVLFSGLLSQYVSGAVGLVLNLLCLFVNGVGVDLVLAPIAAYNVDIMHSRSAEAMAANSALSSVLMSLAIAAILPMVNTYGVAVTNSIAALIAWTGFGLLWFTLRYGERMRALVDVGYSTATLASGNNLETLELLVNSDSVEMEKDDF